MDKIGIIGGGFAGTMTAVQLIEKSSIPCEIIIIGDIDTFNRGIAYSPYSDKQLLNVITGKMSAFHDRPNDFLDGVMKLGSFKNKDRVLISNSFLPRKIYGDYLVSVWSKALTIATSKEIKITFINDFVVDIDANNDFITLVLDNNPNVIVDKCVIASGNLAPRNPKINNESFYLSQNYYRNPWKVDSVKGVSNQLPVLIIGNGLTMVDTVFGLLEEGFKGVIYSLSPNGFNILPHRHNGLVYTKLVEELDDNLSLHDLFKLIHRHIKEVKEYGVSAEPVIDSLRPHLHRIWRNFSEAEKKQFMSRFRHLWGVARHRIPLHSHDKIQKLRIDGKLKIKAGKIIDFKESNQEIEVLYYDKKKHENCTFIVSRIINCTGPESDFMNLDNSFMKSGFLKGILIQDNLKLGIKASIETYQVIDNKGNLHDNLFTIGTNLRGELWESTAVNEIRVQAENLSNILIASIK